MAKIYDVQDSLQISLTYTADVASSIASVKIKYIDPEGTDGEFTAIHDPVNKKVYYNIPKDSPLTVVGGWRFWIYATMTDGRVLPGEVVEYEITEEGTE
jgi:hypothetical protein